MSKNPHLSDTDVFESLDKIFPDTYENRLIGLIEACKMIQNDLKLGHIDDALIILEFALADAQKPMPNAQ
ncbi:MAG: hypothetical protein V7K40_31740 [Nostoc sp.]|uniref:hypothetical protein n=1 Tax=Nostoc sp. TaxID=1180 RepID=UPI002FF819F7